MSLGYDFNRIYDDYYQKVVRYLTGLVGSNDAEDVAQDVFDKISRRMKDFRGESTLSTWIYRIATNSAIDKFRSATYKRASRHVPLEEAAGYEDRTDVKLRRPAATDQTLIRKEMSECVLEFVDKLPPDYRTVIVLSELEGLSNKEISEILRISIDNVKIRLHRGRAKLKAALNEGCEFYHSDHNTLACDRKQIQIFPKAPN